MAALTEDVFHRMPMRRVVTPHVVVWMLLLLSAAVFWPTLSALGRIWLTMADYEHGFAIAAISAVWLFQMRKRIDASEVRPAPLALIGLAVVIGLWMIAWRANSELMQQVLLPVALLLVVTAALGPKVLRHVVAPIAYLYFAIPIWEHFIPLLQWLTTQVAEGLLGLMNVPTEVEGHNVTIPSGRFSIIEGCSGKRYFVIGLAFAAVAAAMQGVRGRRLLWLAGATVAAALVTNWLRVVIVIYAGHISEMQHYLVAVEHKSLGYAMYVPMVLLIVFLARRLGGSAEARAESETTTRPTTRSLLAAAIGPAVLLIAPVVISATGPSLDNANASLGALPLMTGEWQGPLPANQGWHPAFTAPEAELRASYARADRRIEIYVNSYGVQSPGRELVYHLNSAAPPADWTLIRRLPNEAATPPMILASNSSGERWVIARTHVVGGRVAAAPALAQLHYGLSAVWRPAPAGVIALAAPCTPDCEDATGRLRDFWTDNGELLVGLIPESL